MENLESPNALMAMMQVTEVLLPRFQGLSLTMVWRRITLCQKGVAADRRTSHAADDEAVRGDNGHAARLNKDFFANAKAQSWWYLRKLFQNTYRAVVEGMTYNPDEIISISSSMANKDKLVIELSQPTYSINGVGKIIVDKQPEGTKSPNLADSVMINYAPMNTELDIWMRL